MTKGRRIGSETDMYHVVVVGLGRQAIFEDDKDRWNFYSLMERIGDEENVVFYAWCFMGNHVHLVVRCMLEDLSKFMLRVKMLYATSFNERHRRIGSLFQRPFWSDPILTDERMMATVRYVHQNPLKPKLAITCAGYQWSSYCEYVGTTKRSLVDTRFMLEMFGGLDAFESFHEIVDEPRNYIDVDNVRIRRTNEEALAFAHTLIGDDSLSNIAALPKRDRDAKLRVLKSRGITQKQIAWITGLGESIIARA